MVTDIRVAVRDSIGLGLGALVLYVVTLAPTVLWGDDAELQRHAVLGHASGGPRAYELWTHIVHPFTRLPVHDPAWRVQFACAVFAAAAVGILALGLRRSGIRRIAAIAATIAFATSHTFWLHAVRAEVYSLLMLGLCAGTMLLLEAGTTVRVRAARGAGALILGLCVALHPLAVGYVPAVALLAAVRVRIAGWVDGWAVIVPLVTGAILSARFLGVRSVGSGIDGLARAAASLSGPDLLRAFGYLGYQFLLLTPFAIPGAVALRRREPAGAAFLLAAFCGSVFTGLLLRVPDQYVFFMPSYLIAAILIAGGLDAALRPAGAARRWGAVVLLASLLPIPFYAMVPALLVRTDWRPLAVRELPYRDNLKFFFNPPKNGEVGARRFGEEVFAMLPPRAAILADWLPEQTLLYLQLVEGRRPDVLVEDATASGRAMDWIRSQSRVRPVFIADDQEYYPMDQIRSEFVVRPFGPVFELQPRRGPDTSARPQ